MFLFTLFLSVSQDSFEIVVRLRRRRGRGLKFLRETVSFVLSATLVFASLRPTQVRS